MPARSSRLLINEPPLQVLPTLARLIGLNEALFLQQLHYWLERSGKNHDGRQWIYNTYAEWLEQFPFWSNATLRRIVGNLEGSGLVLSSSAYNQSKIDRTKWYTIDYDALDRLSESADHVLNMSRSSDQTEQMDLLNMDRSNQEINQEINDREKPGKPFLIASAGMRSDLVWRAVVDELVMRGIVTRGEHLRSATIVSFDGQHTFRIRAGNDVARRRLANYRDEVAAALARLIGETTAEIDLVTDQAGD